MRELALRNGAVNDVAVGQGIAHHRAKSFRGTDADLAITVLNDKVVPREYYPIFAQGNTLRGHIFAPHSIAFEFAANLRTCDALDIEYAQVVSVFSRI